MVSKSVKRSVIRIEPANVQSIRLAERCGYFHTGVVSNAVGTQYFLFVNELANELG
jgi:RimJ/RimL family protein N-acetyltransferase